MISLLHFIFTACRTDDDAAGKFYLSRYARHDDEFYAREISLFNAAIFIITTISAAPRAHIFSAAC